MDFYKGTIPIIDTDRSEGHAYAMPVTVDGRAVGYGLVPRDYTKHPQEMFDAPSGITVFDESEWDALFDEQEAQLSSLEHLYLSGPGGTPRFINLDQNGHGYCWCYSTGHAVMLQRLKMNLAPVRLNPHSLAAIIKGGRDQGGWCGESGEKARTIGYAPEGNGPGEWPLHSRSLAHDTPAMREVMAKYTVAEDWYDLTRPIHGQVMTRLQLATMGFTNTPAPSDFNWWGHSVCQIRWVRIERGSWGPLILNSWKGWGRHGLGVLRGSKAVADGAIAIRAATVA